MIEVRFSEIVADGGFQKKLVSQSLKGIQARNSCEYHLFSSLKHHSTSGIVPRAVVIEVHLSEIVSDGGVLS